MSGWIARTLLAAFVTVSLTGLLAAKPPIDVVSASYFGDGDLQGAAVAPDGTIYLVGNSGAAAKDLPGGVQPGSFGTPVKEPKCGHGFVAQLSADGKKLLRYAEFARGSAASRSGARLMRPKLSRSRVYRFS